jgi:hypothetical protein
VVYTSTVFDELTLEEDLDRVGGSYLLKLGGNVKPLLSVDSSVVNVNAIHLKVLHFAAFVVNKQHIVLLVVGCLVGQGELDDNVP